MSIRRDIESSLEEAERDLDSPVMEWQGALIPCVPSYERTATLIDSDGNPLTTDLALLVRRENFITSDTTVITSDSDLVLSDNFTPAPKSGEIVVFEKRNYKVITREWCAAKAFVRFRCADPDSGQ